MLRKVCDCCGKDVRSEIRYKLPSYVETGAFNKGVKLLSFVELKDIEMDLCDECVVKIATYICALKK